jgi:hypothetical protein
MENKHEIIDLFPTPLFIAQIPPYLANVTTFLDSQEMTPFSEGASHGSRSLNSYILEEKPCLELKNFILSQSKIYGKEYLSYGYDSYRLSQSWITFKHPTQTHVQHSHPNSLISGVVYYGDFTPKTPSIDFYRGFGYTMGTFALQPSIDPNNLTLYSSNTFSLHPPSGSLILFPSYLQHSVPKNETNKIRKSLAFNIVPSKGFGDEELLSELKFN